jgi:LPXTG-site transpeptidase (sortase) family protein
MLNYSLKSNFKRIFQYFSILGIFVIGIIFIVSPFYPEIEFQYNKKFHPEKFTSDFYFDTSKVQKPKDSVVTLTTTTDNIAVAAKPVESELPVEEKPVPSKKYYNDIIIPSIALDLNIFDGNSEKELDKGAWLKPNGARPDQNGNTVITGHRYTYFNGVRPFYNMDKVNKGDKVNLIWRGEKIDYVIEDKFTVKPEDVWIEKARDGKYLTIYTCEGLDAAKRIVVVAKQV